uniref:Uncharacterized protein n=1 Tax=Trichuris muris TaxID=70415 RepID=A0A5S6QE28_TRIMR
MLAYTSCSSLGAFSDIKNSLNYVYCTLVTVSVVRLITIVCFVQDAPLCMPDRLCVDFDDHMVPFRVNCPGYRRPVGSERLLYANCLQVPPTGEVQPTSSRNMQTLLLYQTTEQCTLR